MDRRDGREAGGAAPSARRRALVAGAVTGLLLSGLAWVVEPSRAITPEAEQTWETGTIRSVADGDTVIVDVQTATDPDFVAPADPAARSYCAERFNADGTMPADGDIDRCRIRLIGIQAPEKAGAAGGSSLSQCHASAATAALAEALPPGTAVQLRSISPRSVEEDYSGGRLARTVYYRDSRGQWVDAGRTVLAGGHAMWFPHGLGDTEKPEHVHNLEYRRLVDGASARGLGLWSPGYCGTSPRAAIRMWVVSDPIGDDAGREHVVVRNDSSAALAVGGWTLRDSSLTTYTLPAGTVIGPRDHIRIFTGRGVPGTPTPRDFHFGGPAQMFANVDPAAGYFHGDGVYLYDTQPGFAYGNLRAWVHYPCDPAACLDPLVGTVVFGTVQYNPPGSDTAAGEYVELRNRSARPVSLAGYALARRWSQYPFPLATTIPARGTLRISMGVGADTGDRLFLGRTASLLGNSGDHLALLNLNYAPVDCRAWGTFSCAGLPVSGALNETVASAPPPTTRPAAPTAVRVSAKSTRITVRWTAPTPNGTKKVTKYRAKVYLSSSKALKYRTSCTAKSKTLKCRTKKLPKGRTYIVKVQARNAQGYGPFSAPVSVRVK